MYNKSGGFGNGYVPLFIVVGNLNKVYYDENDGYVDEGFRTALRLAIDEMPAPGNANFSVSSFAPTAAENTSIQDLFNIDSDGGGDLSYSLAIEYGSVVASGSTWHTNDFNSGIGYTNTGWAIQVGDTWNDGTDCADAADSSTPSVMTSDAFDTSGIGDRLWLELKYGTSYKTGAYLMAEYWDGSQWVEVWRFEESGVGSAKIELPIKSTNTQVRFTAVGQRVQGVWSIERLDDIAVYSDDQAYQWLLFDNVNEWGEPTEVGSIPAGTNKDFNLTFDATGLTAGTYNADIKVTCSDPDDSPFTLPVTFTVTSGGGGDPAQPANVVTGISGTDLVIDWDVSANATGYDVYSSDDPYGTFTFVTSVGTNQYTVAADQAKLFYYIIATN
ncbi:MAG: hypothetical protein GQ534_08715 [Candidatus Delongbacteria bacterium]|nr:hypothetical protein [Candidatus Delongbacteria bacterium]